MSELLTLERPSGDQLESAVDDTLKELYGRKNLLPENQQPPTLLDSAISNQLSKLVKAKAEGQESSQIKGLASEITESLGGFLEKNLIGKGQNVRLDLPCIQESVRALRKALSQTLGLAASTPEASELADSFISGLYELLTNAQKIQREGSSPEHPDYFSLLLFPDLSQSSHYQAAVIDHRQQLTKDEEDRPYAIGADKLAELGRIKVNADGTQDSGEATSWDFQYLENNAHVGRDLVNLYPDNYQEEHPVINPATGELEGLLTYLETKSVSSRSPVAAA